LSRNHHWHRTNDLALLIKTQKRRFFTNVDRCRNEFATVNTISGWTHNLGHVRPETIPTFTTKKPPVAGTAHRHPSITCLIHNGIDILWFDKRIAQAPPFWVRVNLHNVRILDRAAKTANTEFFAWSQATDRP
jgi:hypothetical protein